MSTCPLVGGSRGAAQGDGRIPGAGGCQGGAGGAERSQRGRWRPLAQSWPGHSCRPWGVAERNTLEEQLLSWTTSPAPPAPAGAPRRPKDGALAEATPQAPRPRRAECRSNEITVPGRPRGPSSLSFGGPVPAPNTGRPPLPSENICKAPWVGGLTLHSGATLTASVTGLQGCPFLGGGGGWGARPCRAPV